MATRTADLFQPAITRTRPGFFGTLFQRMALQRQRQRLAELPDHLLKDVGLTQEAAAREANRPAWDAPAHFRH